MKQEREVRISYLAAHLTTVVSVALVLVLAGAIAFVSVAARRESRELRGRLEVTLVMADSVSDSGASALAREIAGKPYAASVACTGRDEALAQWKADTGEDLEELFGANPLSPEIIFSLHEQYASGDSLCMIRNAVALLPGVAEVALPDSDMVRGMNRNINGISLLLGAIALAMLVISFILINNTVHLSVYARRFSIHTMQLVGATDGFIRRPFVGANLLAGFAAGICASAVLGACLLLLPEGVSGDAASFIGTEATLSILLSLPAAGTVLCGCAAAAATTRYLHRDYDDLFK